jgi:hypothetical protein
MTQTTKSRKLAKGVANDALKEIAAIRAKVELAFADPLMHMRPKRAISSLTAICDNLSTLDAGVRSQTVQAEEFRNAFQPLIVAHNKIHSLRGSIEEGEATLRRVGVVCAKTLKALDLATKNIQHMSYDTKAEKALLEKRMQELEEATPNFDHTRIKSLTDLGRELDRRKDETSALRKARQADIDKVQTRLEELSKTDNNADSKLRVSANDAVLFGLFGKEKNKLARYKDSASAIVFARMPIVPVFNPVIPVSKLSEEFDTEMMAGEYIVMREQYVVGVNRLKLDPAKSRNEHKAQEQRYNNIREAAEAGLKTLNLKSHERYVFVTTAFRANKAAPMVVWFWAMPSTELDHLRRLAKGSLSVADWSFPF